MNDEQVMHAMSLDDVYHVERVLAHGAGGLTELVSIDGTGPFVRKKLPVEIANQGVWSTIGALDCKRLPKVEATYSLPDQFVVVYDYVPGQTLEELVTSRGRLDAAEAASLAGDICEAAAALHSCGIIHRDLSPRNVIVAADGAHLIDLGIARMRVEGATRDTTSLGTRGFASPEQYGFAQTDARSDVYAIGKLLGYMLTGMQPDGEEYESQLGDPIAVDPCLAAVVRRACAFEPSARYQTAAQMAVALERPEDEVLGNLGGPRPGATGRQPSAPTESHNGGAGKKPLVTPARLMIVVGVLALLAAVALTVRLAIGGGDATDSTANSSAVGSANASGESASGSGAASGGSAGSGAASGGSAVSSGSDSSASSSASTSASNVAAAPTDDDEDLPLEIVESGWSAGNGGYVHFAAGVKNSSDDTAYELVVVKVVGYDKDGSVLFSHDAGLMVCLPGQTTYCAGQAGGGTAPDRVEFTLQKTASTSARRMKDKLEMKATDLSISKNYGTTTFVCTYSVAGSDEAFSSISSYMNSTAVVIVLRDVDGNIVYGTNGYSYSLELGENQTTQVDAVNVPTYATAEAYVMPW